MVKKRGRYTNSALHGAWMGLKSGAQILGASYAHKAYKNRYNTTTVPYVPQKLAAYKPVMLPKKKKSIHQKAINVGTGGSMSKFFYGRRKVPRGFRTKGLAKNYFVSNYATRLQATVGKQEVANALVMCNLSDLTTIKGRVSATDTSKYMLDTCSAEVMISNRELTNVRVYVYDVIARRDLNNVPTAAQGWTSGYADEGGADSNYQVVGTLPFSDDIFTQFFKVLKITHITLAQGQVHTHRVRFSPRKLIDGECLKYVNNGIKGLTCFTMVVVHGYPENDTTTKTQVSTGTATVDIISRKQYKYMYMVDSDTSYYQSNNLPSAFTVNESIVDMGSGAVTTDQQA